MEPLYYAISFAPEKWPFNRGDLKGRKLETKICMLRFTLSLHYKEEVCLSRGVASQKGLFLMYQEYNHLFMNAHSKPCIECSEERERGTFSYTHPLLMMNNSSAQHPGYI